MSDLEVDVEDVVIAYLSSLCIVPAGQVSARMPSTPAMPFILIQRVAGGDDFIVDSAAISVHAFNSDQTGACTVAEKVRHAMRQLTPKTPVTMTDGSVVIPYAPTYTELAPVFLEWEPSGGGLVLSRYVARYNVRVRLPSIYGY
jgi:hypothetical protein